MTRRGDSRAYFMRAKRKFSRVLSRYVRRNDVVERDDARLRTDIVETVKC